MAGAGYKLFNTGDVLTAAQVNTYLQEQTVMVFASAAARTTALTGVVAEGMISYLTDTDVVQYYNGTTWTTINTDQTPLTTKGDLFTFSTVDARLGVGANDTVLTAASGETTGLKWDTRGGFTLINAGGTALTGTTVTISSIPATYKHLFIVASNYYTSTADAETELRFNSDTGNNYTYNRIRNLGTTVAGFAALATNVLQINTRTIAANTSGKLAASSIWIYNYTDTTPNKYIDWKSSAVATSDVAQFLTGQGNYKGTSAISSVSIINGSTFSGGTIYVYGVN